MQLLLQMLKLLLLMLLLLLLLLKLHGYSVCSCCCDASRHRCDAGFAAPAVSSLRDAAPSGCCQTQLIVWYRIEQPLPEASEVLPHVPAPTQQPLAPGAAKGDVTCVAASTHTQLVGPDVASHHKVMALLQG
jgi:hypothetical protein